MGCLLTLLPQKTGNLYSSEYGWQINQWLDLKQTVPNDSVSSPKCSLCKADPLEMLQIERYTVFRCNTLDLLDVYF